MSTQEKEIENSILEFLEYSPGCKFYKKNNTGVFDPQKGIFRKNHSRFIPLGASDLYGSFYSIATYIEIKTPKEYKYIMTNYHHLKNYLGDDAKKLRYQSQILFLEENVKKGCIGFFAESVVRVKNELALAYEHIKKRGVIQCL